MAAARALRGSQPAPGLLLVSPAVRTQQTAELLQVHAFPGVPVLTERPLYQATLAQLLDCLRDLDDAIDSVVLIGHNPGLSELCTHLSTDSETVELDTAEHRSVALPLDRWSDLP
jgi:phosphohistidine phosphatase